MATAFSRLNTPIGGFETFQIKYSLKANAACTTFDCSSSNGDGMSSSGTVWFAKKLGPVKHVDNAIYKVAEEILKVKTTMLISETNVL